MLIEFDEGLFLVELRWSDRPLDFRQLAPHLVTLYGCPDLRGLLISSSGFTDQAIRDLSSIQPQRLVLCQLQEIVLLLEAGPRPEGAPSRQGSGGRDRAEGPGFQFQVIDSRPVRRSRVFGFSKATPSHQIDPQFLFHAMSQAR